MRIELARRGDIPALLSCDRHLPVSRLTVCVDQGMVYALRLGGRVVGVLRYSLFWQTIPFLDLIFLEEACRGQGFGRQAMAFWEKAMLDNGFRYAMVSTQADETARFFYEKLGYHRIGAFLPPEQEADELLYLKELE